MTQFTIQKNGFNKIIYFYVLFKESCLFSRRVTPLLGDNSNKKFFLTPPPLYTRTESVNGMVSHVKLSHPTSIICWVCGQSWSDKQGKVTWWLDDLMTWWLDYLITWLLVYLITWLLDYLITRLLDYLITWLLDYLMIFQS